MYACRVANDQVMCVMALICVQFIKIEVSCCHPLKLSAHLFVTMYAVVDLSDDCD